MNILLLGSGGREHALAWEIAASPLVERPIFYSRVSYVAKNTCHESNLARRIGDGSVEPYSRVSYSAVRLISSCSVQRAHNDESPSQLLSDHPSVRPGCQIDCYDLKM
jgi:hypothetical protein